MDSEWIAEARPADIEKEEINKDVLICTIKITHKEIEEVENIHTLINVKLDIMRQKIIEKLQEKNILKD